MKYSAQSKQTLVRRYLSGKSVATLTAKHNIPRSTFYSWIKPYRKLKSSTDTEFSCQDYHNLKRLFDKLEEKLQVIKSHRMQSFAPLQEKLRTLEKLYGQHRTSCKF